MEAVKKISEEEYEKMRQELDTYKSRAAELEASNAALTTEKKTGLAAVNGSFKANLKENGATVKKNLTFKLGSPQFFRNQNGVMRHCEATMKVANGETVTRDFFKPMIEAAQGKEGQSHMVIYLGTCENGIEELTQVAAQAELQHLANMGYQYLEAVKA